MIAAIIIFTILATILGLILGFSQQKFKVKGNPLVDKINDILPQTQCGQCNFSGCKPYAEALARGDAEINLCPPGGQDGVDALADLLCLDTMELGEKNTLVGVKMVAQIIEEDCIGCTLCIKACPVDAIVGASKVMTTVIANECTGCELCLAPCPVDCIEMIKVEPTINNYIPIINR